MVPIHTSSKAGKSRFPIQRLICFILLFVLMGSITVQADSVQRIIPSVKKVKLTVGDSKQINVLVEPSSADPTVKWVSSKPKVVNVSETGYITGLKAGSAVIRVYSVTNPRKKASVTVSVLKGVPPKSILVQNAPEYMTVDQKLQLNVVVNPAKAPQSVQYRSSNTNVAEVNATGEIHAKSTGKTTITVRSTVKTTVAQSFILEVYDPLLPQHFTIDECGYLELGETRLIHYTILPETAVTDIYWSSSNPSCVSIDANGVLHANATGTAILKGKTTTGNLEASSKMVVLNGKIVSTVPARNTSMNSSEIQATLDAIDAIHTCADEVLDRLFLEGTITDACKSKRKSILSNAFCMYRFPWYTTEKIPYWNPEYDGLKDFYPGRVYYGLPYIQFGNNTNRTNRRFNVDKALAQGYYAKAENSLYKITQKRLSGKYVGNDCSAFVLMSTLPVNGINLNNSQCFMITRDMLASSLFTHIPSYNKLLPGDLLCKSGHTLMFLYYTDTSKTRMMVIEQGGGNTTTDVHNTITCSVLDRAAYENKYEVLRARFL